MINLETVKALRALHLPGMARELEPQLEDPQNYKSLSFEERLGMMVDAKPYPEGQTQLNGVLKKPG